jgi:hypothetical protein
MGSYHLISHMINYNHGHSTLGVLDPLFNQDCAPLSFLFRNFIKFDGKSQL